MNERFAIYLRTSTKKKVQDGIDGFSFASQENACRQFVKNNGGEVVGVFSDQASGAIRDRKGLVECLAFARETNATVLISRLDRISRQASFIMELCDKGVPFRVAEMPNATPFQISIYACLAQEERAAISARVKSAMAIAKKLNKVKFGTKTPAVSVAAMNAGARAAKQKHFETIKPVIDDIRSTGVVGLKNIADCLNRRGYLTRRNNPWTPSSLWRYAA